MSFSIPSYYEVFAVLGQGAYGYVAAANVRSGSETETVAVKKMSAWSEQTLGVEVQVPFPDGSTHMKEARCNGQAAADNPWEGRCQQVSSKKGGRAS